MKDQIESTTPAPTDADTHEIGELIYLDPKLLKPHPLGSRMPPPSLEQFEAMRDSIRRFGVMSALRVTEDYEILCGHTRCRIALEEGLPKVPVRVVRGLSPSDQFHLAVFENFERRHMTPSQRAAWVTHPEVFGSLNDELKAQAKARMLRIPRMMATEIAASWPDRSASWPSIGAKRRGCSAQ